MMVHKKLIRDRQWGFQGFPFYQMRIENEDFKGIAAVIRLLSGEKMMWNERVQVAGAGMTWLELIPDGRHHAVTAMILPNGRVSNWYVDIIDGIEYDEEGICAFIDKKLDVVIEPGGPAKIVDADELKEIFDSGEIDEASYREALNEGELVAAEMGTDTAATEEKTLRILAAANKKIDLFLNQKHTMDTFLSTGALSKEQYDFSLNGLKTKLGLVTHGHEE